MNPISEEKEKIRQLFASQMLAVLATDDGEFPYTSLVAFSCTEDLKCLLFVTDRFTRKYKNMEKNPHVSLLIDSRSNRPEDFENAIAVTAVGRVAPVGEDEKEEMKKIFLSKHPRLKDFVNVSATVLMKVETDFYYPVSRFQQVREISMKE
ncbi:MAG: pyridoxamine 5'-phosphate oxidase family protein [Desulfobacterales bacterium]